MDGSCYTCLRRRIECEMSEPPCKKCKKAGIECFQKRPFRWVQGAAFRGKKKAASAKATSFAPTASAKLSRTPTRTGEACPEDKNCSEPILVSCNSDNGRLDYLGDTVPLPLDDPCSSSLDKVSKYYLYYYSKCVCKLFIMYDSNRNPLRKLIPAALDNSVLLASIVALSARHMANGDQSFYEAGTPTFPGLTDAHHNALWFKHKAIKELSEALNDEAFYKQDTIIASAFLLIFLDLLELGSDKWNFHLEGVKSLINQIQSPAGSQAGPQQDLGDTIQGIRDFIIRQVYLIDTLGTTYTRPRLLSKSAALRQSLTPLQMSVDKSYLGCPEYLLDTLRSFALCRDCLASSEPLDDATIYSYTYEIMTFLDSTQAFDCQAWATGLSLPHSKADRHMLSILAESYKVGTLIYGRRVLSALTGDTTSLDGLVQELISSIDTMRSDEALFKCILWPMFVAGLESRQQDQRDFVICCLEKFWFETKCINVVNGANLLKKFWKEDSREGSSSQWIFSIGQLGRDWLLI
ncbi:fungal-specific transcription factor domain-containing protein [Aspergillus alliaceus]|uniref:Fungal-specific transcription factor domain-containing protein n=1 Tax=Petromyces alliaceus TaxID=209559 RepID=A0A5N7BUW6_PETAA|nr:fungal-specific transcription factor domain-containing protein [Aspergillus alliaceus]